MSKCFLWPDSLACLSFYLTRQKGVLWLLILHFLYNPELVKLPLLLYKLLLHFYKMNDLFCLQDPVGVHSHVFRLAFTLSLLVPLNCDHEVWLKESISQRWGFHQSSYNGRVCIPVAGTGTTASNKSHCSFAGKMPPENSHCRAQNFKLNVTCESEDLLHCKQLQFWELFPEAVQWT